MKNEITNSGDIEREGKGVINTYHTCPPPFWKAFSPLEPFFSERFPDIFPFTAVYCLGIRHEVLSDIPTCALSQLSLSPSLMSFSNHRNDISIVVWAINIWFSDEMISCFVYIRRKGWSLFFPCRENALRKLFSWIWKVFVSYTEIILSLDSDGPSTSE